MTKREVTDKVGKEGILACTDIRTCEDSVESIPPQEEANTDKASKQGLLAGLYSDTSEAQVKPIPSYRQL